MNEIMNTTGGAPITMSSREIAELTGKRHPDVKRDIEKMLNELEEDMSKFAHIYQDSMNRDQTEYRLDRELTETLLLGYSALLRRKVLARLRELEGIVANPAQALNDPASLRTLLLQNVEKVIELESKVQELIPSQNALNRIAGSDDLIGVRITAKILDMAERKFTDWIQRVGVAYRQNGTKKLLCYADKHKAGYCKNVAETYPKPDGTDGVRETLKFYPRGIIWLAKRLNISLTEGDIRAMAASSNKDAA